MTPGDEKTILLSTREFLANRIHTVETPAGVSRSIGHLLVGRWIVGSRTADEPPTETQEAAFKVARSIGHGALGEVFEVRFNTCPQLAFALKVPLLPIENTAAAIRHEVDKLNRLSHPHLPRLYLTGELELLGQSVPYYVTDLLRPLAEELPDFEKRRPVPAILVARLFYALAHALSYLSEQSVVHNDVKPDNIMFLAGCPYLTDFGTARSSGEINEVEENRLAGRLFGTPRWLPPEIVDVVKGSNGAKVVLHPDRISQKTDVYGLGLVALRLLSGRDLFEGAISGDLGEVFFYFHELLRNQDLLGRYQRQVAQILERTYLGTDPIADSRLRDSDVQRLYQRFDTPSSAYLRPSKWGENPAAASPAARPARFAGIHAKKTFLDDLLRLAGACLAPNGERIKAPALVQKMESLWAGIDRPGNPSARRAPTGTAKIESDRIRLHRGSK
ncbi:MAG: protein kinase [Planctomycetes bacterium]|nr:protein kinase [Planctomycetota bacterium]